MTWQSAWFGAIKDIPLPNQKMHKALWQAARIYYQIMNKVKLFDGFRLKRWAWLWRIYIGLLKR